MKTSVEWLYQHLFPKQLDGFSEEEWRKIDAAFEQAKEMEKEQIIDANIAGMEFIPVDPNRHQEDAEQYYNETFNTEEPELVQINQDNPVTKGSTALVRTFNTEEK
jgi:hypothetical protein